MESKLLRVELDRACDIRDLVSDAPKTQNETLLLRRIHEYLPPRPNIAWNRGCLSDTHTDNLYQETTRANSSRFPHGASWESGLSVNSQELHFRVRVRSNAAHTPSPPSQAPRLAAFEYSVARCSKKLACSTPLRISTNHGSGCGLTWR